MSKTNGMTAAQWTTDELVGLIGHRRVTARSATGASVPIPPTLAAALPASADLRSEAAELFSGDKTEYSMAWWNVIRKPTESTSARVRVSRGDGPYMWEVVTLINLLDVPTMNVMLSVVEATGEVAQVAEHNDVQIRARTPAMIQYLDGTGQIRGAHGDVAEIYGRPADEVRGVLPLTLISAADVKRLIGVWVALLADPSVTQQYTIDVPRPNGSVITLETTLLNRLADPAVGAVVAVSHDVTERVLRARALDASERRFRRLVEKFPTPVFTADASGLVLSVSEPALRMLAGTDVGPFHLWDLVAFGEAAPVRTAWADLMISGELDVVATDRSQTRVFRFRATTATIDAVDLEEILCTVEDVTAEMAERDELSWQATRDEQTGVGNRTGLRRGWEQLREAGRPIGVLFLDLDDFKQVNDSFGHAVGDEVLAEIGERLRSFARADDVVARFGGDEFVVLLSLSSSVDDPTTLSRFRQELCRPVLHSAGIWNAKVSVGFVEASPIEALESAVSRADRSMYEEKARRKALEQSFVS